LQKDEIFCKNQHFAKIGIFCENWHFCKKNLKIGIFCKKYLKIGIWQNQCFCKNRRFAKIGVFCERILKIGVLLKSVFLQKWALMQKLAFFCKNWRFLQKENREKRFFQNPIFTRMFLQKS
jgi:hypothetical protein